MQIIKDKFVLSHNYKPQQLPVREKLVKELVSNIKTQNGYSALLSGLTGTGKTISVGKAVEELNNDGGKFLIVSINCSECKNYTGVAKKIIEEVKGKHYDERGKTKSQVADDLKKVLLTKRKKILVFVFDEIDKLVLSKADHQEVLFPILNSCSNSSFILISNDTNILSKLDPRLQSRLAADIKNIPVYQPEENYLILEQRAKLGLEEGSYDKALLNSLAKFSSDVSGDIRFALRLLERVASYAETDGYKKIPDWMVKEVINELENSEFEKKFLSLNTHLKLALLAVSLETSKNVDGYAITYPDSYNTYVLLVKNHNLTAMGDRRFRDYLVQLQMMDLISLQNKSTHKRGGRVRIAVPNFDFRKLIDMVSIKKGGFME